MTSFKKSGNTAEINKTSQLDSKTSTKSQISNSTMGQPQKPEKQHMLPMGDFEEPTVYSKFTLHEDYFKKIEPAGEAFEVLLAKKLNPQQPDMLLEDSEDVVIEEDKAEYEWEIEYRSSRNFSNGFSKKEENNYYSILGLENEFLNATAEDIRRAYKKVALLYHPDKKECETEDERQEANKNWLKFKDAYETLLDPDKKLKYDSTFKFDDGIPELTEVKSKIKSESDFFRLFGPVFLRNSIWSTKKPVPKIGDMNTELKKVKRFYNFWYSFSTWRNFEAEGEYDVNDAENRWEKRQMQKENKKLKSSQLKEEKARIRRLIDTAYQNDPRILAEERRIQEDKEKLKKERTEFVLKQKTEKEENERRLKFEYEERKRREAEEREILKKNLYEKLIVLVTRELNYELSNDDVLAIKLNASVENMSKLLSEVELCGNLEDKWGKFKEISSKILGLKFKSEAKESSVWSREEVFSLQKAVKRYPAGTVNRWEKIMEVVKTKGVNQIIKMTHYLATNPSVKFNSDTVDLAVLLGGKKEELKEKEKVKELEKDDVKEVEEKKKEDGSSEIDKEQWSDFQQKALENALKKFPNSIPANERWNKISAEVPGKTKKQCVERFKHLSQLIKNK